MSKSARIIILNYDGEELLRKNLAYVEKAAKASVIPCPVTVLDNASRDGSLDYIRSRHPDVNIYRSEKNRVLCSYNDYLKNVQEDIVILLNNDLKPDINLVDPLINVFDKYPKAFFASTRADRSIALWTWATLTASFSYGKYRKASETFGATLSTGMAAFDRRKFLELGGYDDLYLPGRYEDLDLCFRGWKRGWKGFHVPESEFHHEGYGSFKKHFTKKEIEAMVFRNSILFMVKNIEDKWFLTRFIFILPFRLMAYLCMGRWHFLKGFVEALQRLPEALRRRSQVLSEARMTDREVIQEVNAGQLYEGSLKIRVMKYFVSLCYRHRVLRSILLGIGFWSIRLTHPLQYFILRELMDAKSVLDLGCGNHSMIPILPYQIYKVGVEKHQVSFREAVRKARHDRYLEADIRELDFGSESFDAAVALDVIEHLTKEEGVRLIGQMKKWAAKKVFLYTPNGFLRQEEYDENPLMKHQSGWSVSELKSLGFKVYGVNGFKALKNPSHSHDGHQRSWLDVLIDTTQIFTYCLPERASHLLCVWEHHPYEGQES